ncbi:MAG: hypothetical protein ABIJ09_25650 [Pseudomonadota bacterium]
MSATDPQTLDEWQAYIAALDDTALVEQARAANSTSFVQQLQDEGKAPHEIHGVLVLFAHRFKDVGLRPPGDGYCDLLELMNQSLPEP